MCPIKGLAKRMNVLSDDMAGVLGAVVRNLKAE